MQYTALAFLYVVASIPGNWQCLANLVADALSLLEIHINKLNGVC